MSDQKQEKVVTIYSSETRNPYSDSMSDAQQNEPICNEAVEAAAQIVHGFGTRTEWQVARLIQSAITKALQRAEISVSEDKKDSGITEADVSAVNPSGTDRPFAGSRFTPVAPGITLGCITPEARDLLDRVMEDWYAFEGELKANHGSDFQPSIYQFAYWLIRWSGLVAPSVGAAPKSDSGSEYPQNPLVEDKEGEKEQQR